MRVTVINRSLLVPVSLFIFLIGAVTALQALVSGRDNVAGSTSAQSLVDQSLAAASALAGPDSDRTLLQYGCAADLLKRGDKAQALRLLEANRNAPLVLAVSDTSSGIRQDMAPAVQIVELGRHIAAQARKEAKTGNQKAALRWVRAGRNLAAQLLATPGPTLDTVITVRALDSYSNTAAADVYRCTGDAASAIRIAERERALEEYMQQVVLPSLRDAYAIFARSVRSISESAAGGYPKKSLLPSGEQDASLKMHAQYEADISADMLALYREKRGGLLSENT